METEPQPNPIAPLNDEFRPLSRQDFYLTQGALSLPDVPGLIQAVRTLHDFTPNNDPRGEHDMGAIILYEHETRLKIDYFDQQLRYWHDPLSPECRRVLMVMLASEY